MLTNPTRTLGLMLALGSVSCGGGGQSTPGADPYLGFVDSTGLDSKFAPNTSSSGPFYPRQTSNTLGGVANYYFFGSINSGFSRDKNNRPVLKADALAKITSYDFADGCAAEGEYDPGAHFYRPDAQGVVFDGLPFPGSSTSPAVPLVKVQKWAGTGEKPCNAIKNHESLLAGDFGGAAAEEPATVHFRAIIDMTASVNTLKTGSTFLPKSGWYKGMQLQYIDAGPVPVDADGNIVMQEGVLVHPAAPAAGAAPSTSNIKSNNVLVLQYRPGQEGWSPVVRVSEWTIPTNPDPTKQATPSSFRSLCFESCTSATAVDMTKLKTRDNNGTAADLSDDFDKFTHTSVAFLAGSAD